MMNDNLKRDVLKCIAITSNPFLKSELSSRNKTLASISKYLLGCNKFQMLQLLQILKDEVVRLNELVEDRVGSMSGAEIMMENKERLWNCRAAFEYVEGCV